MTILWTIMPTESLQITDTPAPLPQKELVYHGVPLLVESVETDQYKIVRILSTDPNDYLLEDLQPGSCLML